MDSHIRNGQSVWEKGHCVTFISFLCQYEVNPGRLKFLKKLFAIRPQHRRRFGVDDNVALAEGGFCEASVTRKLEESDELWGTLDQVDCSFSARIGEVRIKEGR